MFNVQTNKKGMIATNEAKLWKQRVLSAGGEFESNSLDIANVFILKLKQKSYYSKIIYLLPMLGKGIGAARAPIIDVLGAGNSTNVNFVNSDFSQSLGLQGNGSSKYLSVGIKPSQLGTSNNGGLGYWENNIGFGSNVEPMGCYASGSNRFVLDLRNSLQAFRWGVAGNGASFGSTASNAHYYGQRSSSSSREIFKNGASLATNTTGDTTSGASDTDIAIVGSLEPAVTPWLGRCAVAYMTDGTMGSADITDFDIFLRDYLMKPTKKPQS